MISEIDPLTIKVADFGFAKFIAHHSSKNPTPSLDIFSTLEFISSLPKVTKSEESCHVLRKSIPSGSKISSIYSNGLGLADKDFLTRTFCGSLAYSAPELVMGSPYDGRKVDSWAIGCVLFIMLTHRMAFKEKAGTKALIQQQMAGPKWPSSSTKLSAAAKNCVERILTFKHQDRPFVDEILNDAWVKMYKDKAKRKQSFQNEQDNLPPGDNSRERRRSVSQPTILTSSK